jgi:hypothetical protein
MNALAPHSALSEVSDAEHPAMQRMRRVISAFNILEPEEQHLFSERLDVIMRAGPPEPAFGLEMEEATFWVRWSSNREIKAYLATAFLSLNRCDRKAFLAWQAGRSGRERLCEAGSGAC